MSELIEFTCFVVAMMVLISPFWGALLYGEPVGWSWMFRDGGGAP